jgi:alpha-beta hydrolase superfamily lysophospholipase
MIRKMPSALRRWRIAALMAGIVIVMVGLCAGLAWAEASYAADAQFYTYAPEQAVGPPGSIIRLEPMSGAPLGANAFRVLYRSTGLHGEAIAVSGVIVVPAGVAPNNGRNIVAWAHPTSGVVSRCAPSEAHFVFQTIMGLREMVRRGYIVAATDYPGLGTQGPHPYLVGSSEARAVIDAVRAARQIPSAQASDRYVVWGHSQGGQAALFTAMLTASYAPDLRLMGVAAAAPATDLNGLLRDDADTDGGRNVTAMTLWSWHRVYGLPINNMVQPAAMPAVDALSNECIESVYDILQRLYSQRPLRKQFLSVADATHLEPWYALVAENSPGTLPATIPVLLTQGGADQLVLPLITRAYAQRLCSAGSRVKYLELAGVGHGFIAADSAMHAVDWITDRFDRVPAPDDCPALAQASQSKPDE